MGRRRRRHLEIQVDIQARELYLEFVPMDLDSDETSRDMDTAVLHKISVESNGESGLVWGAIFEKVAKYKEIHTFPKGACPKHPEILIAREQAVGYPAAETARSFSEETLSGNLPP